MTARDYRFSPLVIRGVHVDCRAQMLRFDRLLEVLEDLARWGFNTVLLEYEDRFPYRGALKPVPGADALTVSQVRQLNKRAAGLGLRIVPLVQCLGHLEYVLRHGRFAALSDRPGSTGRRGTLCPSEDKSFDLYRQMVQQVLDLHGEVRYFHMGGDEAGLGEDCPRCAERRRQVGVSRILVDHYIRCAEWLRGLGPDPIIWCDMALRHPEAMDDLRGKVVIMDWDYWSGTEAVDEPPRVWGLPRPVPRDAQAWPAAHRELFAKYVFTEGGKARAFPYAAYLRDRGFQVIVASAVRSSGDNFCAPMGKHIENVIGAARVAAESHVLGSVITSWALRRAPWPTTEYGLIAGGMTMKNPQVSRQEIDAAFAAEHFGAADPDLARIPLLLGRPVAGLTDSRPRFDDATGGWLGADYDARLEAIRQRQTEYSNELLALRASVQAAEGLLGRVQPRTPRQRSRTAVWKWAADVLRHCADLGPEMLAPPGPHDLAALKACRADAGKLAARTGRLLKGLYTDRTVRDEQQTRFGAQLAYIDRLIGGK